MGETIFFKSTLFLKVTKPAYIDILLNSSSRICVIAWHQLYCDLNAKAKGKTGISNPVVVLIKLNFHLCEHGEVTGFYFSFIIYKILYHHDSCDYH